LKTTSELISFALVDDACALKPRVFFAHLAFAAVRFSFFAISLPFESRFQVEYTHNAHDGAGKHTSSASGGVGMAS